MKVLIISADNFEDSELLYPYYRLQEEKIDVDIASIATDKIKGKKGYEVNVDKRIDDVDPESYDLLILPGGKAPAVLRKVNKVIEIASHFIKNNKPIAAICHGPQILISTGLLSGRHATCYMSVAPELKDVGTNYDDREVVVDGNIVTSRKPGDLPAFMRETLKLLNS
ncbi:MAG: type 1 glutamine amidotransferase [Nitrospiraceae bacterium]|nr:MAG: type 1 glutamine amidotransferase [Nitrospiraceae bacterium]